MALSRAVLAAVAGTALAAAAGDYQEQYTFESCDELKPLRKHYMNNCTVAEYCLFAIASTGYLGNAALELANEGFYVHNAAHDLAHMGLNDLANEGFANDGFIFQQDDDDFVGNAEFANNGFIANLAWAANHGFFSTWSNYEYFDSNAGFFDDITACYAMLQCAEFTANGAFGTCNSNYQYEDVPAPAVLINDCRPGWIGDGICDSICNTPRFMNDGGDCLPENCAPQSVGDGNCDTQCNWKQFDYDGGDCLPANCSPDWLGDGECDTACNWASLNYDGGDCPRGDQASLNAGVEIMCDPSWLGDGSCDPECNTAELEFDSGDCLAYEIFAQNY